MQIKPVKNLVKPNYPDKYEIELNRALLYYRPKSWLKKPIVSLTLAALMSAGLLAGCSESEDDGYGISPGVPPFNPIYISDEDALKIITEELKKAGFGLAANDEENSEIGPQPEFLFDAHFLNDDNKIDVEYVSMDDRWNEKYPDLNYSGYPEPENLAEQLKDIYADAAVFHDPISETPAELIRAQVIDFLEWLMSIE